MSSLAIIARPLTLDSACWLGFDPTNGTFSTTGDTLQAHGAGSTATRLSDGRVLIVGGTDAPDVAELYEPALRTFISAGRLNSARAFHSATLLNNGRVLIAGGMAKSGQSAISLSTAEIYDPQSEVFSPTGDLSIGRASAGAALLANGRVLVVAGFQFGSVTGPSPADSAELYDPASGSFRPAGNLTVPRPAATAVMLSATGKVLVFGDFLGGEISAEVYDPTTESFSATGPPVTLISSAAVTELANGQVLVCGGSVAVGPVITDSAQVYDPVSGTFSAIAGMNTARQQHTATLLRDGRVLVVGGYSTNGPSAVESAELYDPGADFGLALREPVVYANPASRAIVTIDINRIGGFTGEVTVTPPDSSGVGVKVKPAEPLSSTESTVRFKLKIKASAAVGSHPLTFLGKDGNNRLRAVAVTVMIKQ